MAGAAVTGSRPLTPKALAALDRRLADFLEELVAPMGRSERRAWARKYAVAVEPSTKVWTSDPNLVALPSAQPRGRPRQRPLPESLPPAKDLAQVARDLPAGAWRQVLLAARQQGAEGLALCQNPRLGCAPSRRPGAHAARAGMAFDRMAARCRRAQRLLALPVRRRARGAAPAHPRGPRALAGGARLPRTQGRARPRPLQKPALALVIVLRN